ncbi:MAG TPA: NADP-dependent oxidoreductase [Rhabdochlamydiaceae bacterium]|nr:NADP-dependent oxidoreductase [Rhabdochlamydiaceae bacterium]
MMKAVVLESIGDVSGFKLKEVAKPAPNRNEVRIRIKAAGFNPVDTKLRAGAYEPKVPIILGADCSGVIDAVGEDFHEFSVGDEVMAIVFGQGSGGTYAEYVCVPRSFVVHKPKNISFEQAATVPLVSLTAYRACIWSGALQEGRAAFIAGGTGAVGNIAIQLAQIYKAGPIFTTAGNEEGDRLLMDHFGITKKHILNYTGLNVEQMKEKLLEMNRQELFPATIDLVGGKMKELCFAVVDFSGHVATILPETKGFPIELWARGESISFAKSLSVHFIFVGAEAFAGPPKSWNHYRQQLSYLAKLIENGELRIFEPEVVGHLSRETVVNAHQKIDHGKAKSKLVMVI